MIKLFTSLKIIKFIICLNGLLLIAECTFRKSYGRNSSTFIARSSRISTRPNGLALTGYLASIMDYSYVMDQLLILFSNHFKGFIPLQGVRDRKPQRTWKREVDEYPYGILSLKDSLTVKPREYSKKELRELKKVFSLKPENVVVLTVFDKTYIPCESKYARTCSQIVIHNSYDTIYRNAEIALVKVVDPLTLDIGIKLPKIGPIKIEDDKPFQCHVVGYGALKLNRTVYSHPMLSVIDVDVFTPNICQTISRTYKVIIDKDPSGYVCSYNMKYRYGSPLSQGDSGAPLICGENIVGVSQWVFSPLLGYLSFGPSQPTPHIYTKLDVYLPWILNHTENLDDKVVIEKKKREENASTVSEIERWLIWTIMVTRCYLNEVYFTKP